MALPARPAEPFAPSGALHLLRDAAELLGARTDLVSTIAAGYPRSLARRPAQLLRSAGATPDELDALLTAAGFSDLDDLRRHAARESGTRLAVRDRRVVAADAERPDGGDLERTLRLEQDNLAESLRLLQASGALELAARAVLASRHRWVFGDLRSRGHAQLFAADLQAALHHVSLIEPEAGAVGSALGDVGRADSLTVFCFRRYSRLTLRVAKLFAARGAVVVAVTDSDESPVCAHATHVLRVVTRSDSAAQSPTSAAAVGHALAGLVAAGAKGAARRIEECRATAAAMEWYET